MANCAKVKFPILKRSVQLLYEQCEDRWPGLRRRGERTVLEEKLLVWQFNRGRTDALRSIYEQHKDGLVTLATALLIDKSD